MRDPEAMTALTVAMREAHYSHLSTASTVSSNCMNKILDRLQIDIHRQLMLPCCLRYTDQDLLPSIDPFRCEC